MLVLLTLLAISISHAGPDAPTSERRVLMQVYDSTGGGQWSNRSGWGSRKPVCEWYGVRCDFLDGDATRPVVAGLSLDRNNLDGKLPATIADLGHLKFLNVAGNKLRGMLAERLLSRFDHHAFELDVSGNSFSNAVVRATIEYSASGVLCSPTEDLRYRLEIDEAKNRATYQSIRCVDTKSRDTYCLVREGTALPLLRLSRGLGLLGFARLQPEYDFPFTGVTHGVFLTTAAVWGDGAQTSVRTYGRQGPIEAWSAQQLFLGLLTESAWEREFRRPRCDFQK